jgi:hypothetical protein
VDNNYLNLGMNKSGFVHTLPSGRLSGRATHLWKGQLAGSVGRTCPGAG